MLVHEIERGGYARVGTAWFLRPPSWRIRQAVMIDPAIHSVEEHEDGTITVTPSISYSTPDRDDYWQGWLTHGVWISC